MNTGGFMGSPGYLSNNSQEIVFRSNDWVDFADQHDRVLCAGNELVMATVIGGRHLEFELTRVLRCHLEDNAESGSILFV